MSSVCQEGVRRKADMRSARKVGPSLTCLLAFALLMLSAPLSAEPRSEGGPSSVRVRVLRLGPGQDLRAELERFRQSHDLRGAFVVSAVGSLRSAALRPAGRSETVVFEGPLEIVSGSGTLSPDSPHLHVALSDGTGRTVGGHLLEGSLVYTTAELVVGEAETLEFRRSLDSETGYAELEVVPLVER